MVIGLISPEEGYVGLPLLIALPHYLNYWLTVEHQRQRLSPFSQEAWQREHIHLLPGFVKPCSSGWSSEEVICISSMEDLSPSEKLGRDSFTDKAKVEKEMPDLNPA